jgi:hypothetical protein
MDKLLVLLKAVDLSRDPTQFSLYLLHGFRSDLISTRIPIRYRPDHGLHGVNGHAAESIRFAGLG